MNEQAPSTSEQPSPPSSSVGVPVAIVIAGGLIAAALYYGGRVPARTGEETGAGTQAGQVAGDTVGEFRAIDNTDHMRGPVNAKITMIEYSDLECPFCKRFHPTLQQALNEFPNDVRWVYRHFPLEQLHSKAPKEAEATECAGEQGKFWEMVDLIFEVTPANDGLDLKELPALAQKAGVTDVQQFQECLDSGKYADRVAKDLADAEAAGGQGTPYTVLIGPGGTKVPISGAQPYASLKAAIEQLL